MILALAFVASFLLSLGLTPLVRNLALKFKIIDLPSDGRKIHKQPIPLLGGFAVFLAFFIVLFIFKDSFLAGDLNWRHLLGFFSGGLIIMIGGFLDDKYRLSAKKQVIFPLLATLAVILGGVEIQKITNPFGGFFHFQEIIWLSPLLILVWLLGMMYTTKLLDGVDGLVTGVGAIGSFVIFLFTTTTRYYQPDLALTALILTGASLGFLIFNFHPAKIFLGEGGSLFFGYCLGVLAIISGGKIAIALLIMGIPILDVLWTIMRRLLARKNPFKFADKKHLHHRLLNLGLSQKQTVFIFYFLAATFGISGLFLQSRGKILTLGLLILIMLIVVLALRRFDRLKEAKKPTLLLHVCCAFCSTYITEEVLMPKYKVTWFFYNPNLNSEEEYNLRLKDVQQMAKRLDIKLRIVPYHHSVWLKKISGHETDKEKGGRCLICYLDRLKEVAALAKQDNFDFFSTSLLSSPYKDVEAIKKQATDLASRFGVKFLAEDFQSNNGYQKSQELAKQLGIYRQNYCGCEFSLVKINNY